MRDLAFFRRYIFRKLKKHATDFFNLFASREGRFTFNGRFPLIGLQHEGFGIFCRDIKDLT